MEAAGLLRLSSRLLLEVALDGTCMTPASTAAWSQAKDSQRQPLLVLVEAECHQPLPLLHARRGQPSAASARVQQEGLSSREPLSPPLQSDYGKEKENDAESPPPRPWCPP